MPMFKYQARDSSGKLVSGERFAQSEDSLSSQLAKDGLIAVSIHTQKKTLTNVSDFLALLRKKHVTTGELNLFTRQMYTLTRSGVPIVASIKHLASSSHNPRLTQVLQQVAEKLESGQNIATAMEGYPDVFTNLIIGMVRVGQNTGQLDKAFLHLSEYLELESATAQRIKTAMRYPIFVIIAIFVGIIIINLFVIPTFAKVYGDAGIQLPWVTVLLISMSTFLSTYWLYFLIILILIAFFIFQYIKSEKGKLKWHRLLLRIPVFGDLIKRIILQRFARTFSIVVNSGMPILEGLGLVGESVTNRYARYEIINMKEAIQNGSSILQAAYACKIFGSLELQMLAVSEETGELGAMLEEIALYYQREVDYDLKRLTDIIEPILLLAVAGMVLMLALAVYMPIWSLVKLAHHS